MLTLSAFSSFATEKQPSFCFERHYKGDSLTITGDFMFTKKKARKSVMTKVERYLDSIRLDCENEEGGELVSCKSRLRDVRGGKGVIYRATTRYKCLK